MPYIGKQPVVGNFLKLDAITTSATTTFNLTSGGVAYYPQSATNCLVTLNGILQSPTTDYTISGSTIVFASALTTSDVINSIVVLGDVLSIGTPSDGTITSAKLASGTSGLIAWQSVQTTGFTAVAGRGYPCNTTSAAFTVTLPASASAGDTIQIVDYAGTFATNNLTINPNGLKIQKQTSNTIISKNNEALVLTYIDSTSGWLVTTAANEGTSGILVPYSIDFLVVAGGGSGGYYTPYANVGGGGGAGGYITSTQSVNIGTVITVTVGSGGASGGNNSGSSSSISGSGITTITSAGGGNGGGDTNASSGGSGGAGSSGSFPGASGNTPSTSPSQGNNGGNGYQSGNDYSGGGGGGAGSNGSSASGGFAGGNGGVGSITSLITTAQATTYSVGQVVSSSVYFAGGGGGACRNATGSPSTAGTGAAGGGGRGGQETAPTAATNGTANTGGGGGGAHSFNARTNGSGGSGAVIISVPTSKYSGTTTGSPSVTTNGSNTVIIFTGSGTYTT